MILLGPLAAIAIGANLGSTFFGLGAERSARKRREQALNARAVASERQATQAGLGGSSLIAGQQSSVRSTLRDLADRGVVDSSFSAPALTEAASPFELERQRQVNVLNERAADLRLAAAGEAAAAPGFSDFAGAALGELGGFAAMRAGQQLQGNRTNEFLGRLERIFRPNRLAGLRGLRLGPDEAFTEFGPPPNG